LEQYNIRFCIKNLERREIIMSNPNFKLDNGEIKIKIRNKWTTVNFNEYENIEIVGKPGANGVVVKGIHKITGRIDAIKIWLPRKDAKNGEVRESQYYAEIQKIAKLNHPNIVKIYNAWIENSCYFCSMEYIDGCTLKTWISSPRSKWERLDILNKIFMTIKVYQDKGIIHGDIHDNNILIDKAQEIHIIDFGTSVTSKYGDQSKYRENYLMYELVEKVMGDDFSDEIFLFKKYFLNGKIQNKNDVRNVISALVSSTISEYIKLEMIKFQMGKLTDLRDLSEICECIAKGLYINLDFVYKNMATWCSQEAIDAFPQIFYETLEDVVYGEAQNNVNEAEKMQYLSLYVYYMYYKSIQPEIDANIYDKTYQELRYLINKKEYDEYIKIINQEIDLFDLHRHLQEKYDDENEIYRIEGDIRGILESVLSHFYNGYYLHILRSEYLEIQQIKMDKSLCNKIINLSHIYRFNNGIKD